MPELGRTYTSAHIDTALAGKSDTSHNHDHGTLTGLSDDDHTLYALTDGTRLRIVRSATAPSSPSTGQLWADTGLSPAQLKIWTGSAWEVPQALGGGGGVTDHGALTGLGDDDHTQYALSDGTRLRLVRATTAPASPSAGQLWLDTNTTPPTLKEYTGSAWDSPQANPLAHNHSGADITTGTVGSARLPTASDTAGGKVEKATATEGRAGTDAGGDSPLYVPPSVLQAVLGDFLATHIEGLQLSRASNTQVTISTGSAWVPSIPGIVNVAADITLNGPSHPTTFGAANTWYFIYLLNNGTTEAIAYTPGTPNIPTVYKGMARQKPSDNTRRFLGCVRTDGSGNLFKWKHFPRAGLWEWQYGGGSAPANAVNAASPADTNAIAFPSTGAADVANWPPTAEILQLMCRASVGAGSTEFFIAGDGDGLITAGSATPTTGGKIRVELTANARKNNGDGIVSLGSNRQVLYGANPRDSTGTLSIDVMAWHEGR